MGCSKSKLGSLVMSAFLCRHHTCIVLAIARHSYFYSTLPGHSMTFDAVLLL